MGADQSARSDSKGENLEKLHIDDKTLIKERVGNLEAPKR